MGLRRGEGEVRDGRWGGGGDELLGIEEDGRGMVMQMSKEADAPQHVRPSIYSILIWCMCQIKDSPSNGE